MYCITLYIYVLFWNISCLYELATMITIAIPSSYEGQCKAQSESSLYILIALTVLPTIDNVSNCGVSAIYKKHNFNQIFPIPVVILVLFNGSVALGFATWLYTLTYGIWKENDLDVYQVVAFSAMMPLLRM